MLLQQAEIRRLQTHQGAVEETTPSFRSSFDHLDGIRGKHQCAQMPQIINRAVDLASLDFEDAAVAIPRHPKGQAVAMSLMLNRALQADHIRSPPRQLRTSDTAKRAELTQ